MYRAMAGLVLGAALLTPAATWADEAEAPAVNTGALSFSGVVDFTNAYYFRGYLQENDGLIVQPAFTASAALADNISIYGGIWNSLHSEQTGGDDIWYEADLYAGIDFDLAPFTVGLNYTLYTYPNGAFDAIHEASIKLAFDDATLYSEGNAPVVFNPYLLLAYELGDGNGSEDTYLEAGVAPSFPLGDSGLEISVPISLGMSVDDYYVDADGSNEFLGYGTIGLATSIPLPMPAKYGEWNLNASIKYLYLFADGLEAANEGDANELIGTVGVSFAY